MVVNLSYYFIPLRKNIAKPYQCALKYVNGRTRMRNEWAVLFRSSLAKHSKTVNLFRYETLEVCSYVRCLYHNAYLGYVDFLGFSENIGPNVR